MQVFVQNQKVVLKVDPTIKGKIYFIHADFAGIDNFLYEVKWDTFKDYHPIYLAEMLVSEDAMKYYEI